MEREKGMSTREEETSDFLSQQKRSVESPPLIHVEEWSTSTRINTSVRSNVHRPRPSVGDRHRLRAQGMPKHICKHLLSA